MKIHRTHLIVLLLALIAGSCTRYPQSGSPFYVDIEKGKDNNPGTISRPFRTIDKAFAVTGERVDHGILSDTIYLRGGIYRKESSKTLYHFNLQGTPDHPAVFSAMPCNPGDPNGVERKSGEWYEKVVFDDAWVVSTKWTRCKANPMIWQTNPDYVQLEWTNGNLWPWTKYGFPVSDQDSTPQTTLFTVAPFMLLQDNHPGICVQDSTLIKKPGEHSYNQQTGALFFYPFDGKNPNHASIETWYGGAEDYEIGTLHLDGEGRALFDGNMNHAIIRGFEFRMFNKIFEFHRRKYASEADRIVQRNVFFEDNFCQYGWIQILLDANTVHDKSESLILPRFQDRSDWVVRNNVFFRPSREVCQLHGENHLIENNDIIEHSGPWAGCAAIVSIINTRNTVNATIRNNFILGHGNNPWHSGSVFMIEVHGMANGEKKGGHTGADGKYIYGGQTYENNLIANVSQGMAVFVLAKGNITLKDVTIQGNIIYNTPNVPVILITGPHENLRIENNFFLRNSKPFQVVEENYHSGPSSLTIRSNLFYECSETIPVVLSSLAPEGSSIDIHQNLYDNAETSGFGTILLKEKVRFADPGNMNFNPTSPEIRTILEGTFDRDWSGSFLMYHEHLDTMNYTDSEYHH